jgi:hypothetical protein
METNPEPDEYRTTAAAELPTDVGRPLHEFRPGMENVIAGSILALLLVAVGFSVLLWIGWSVAHTEGQIPFFVEKGICWALIAFFGAVAIGAAIGGLLLLRFATGLASQQIWVCSNGLCFVPRGRFDVARWDEIESVQEVVFQEYFPLKGIAKHALPFGKSRTYLVRRQDGREFAVNGKTSGGSAGLGRFWRKWLRGNASPGTLCIPVPSP